MRKNISVKTKYECCGCTACAMICPTNAISMRPDAMGFLYPQVSAEKCVDCGACLKVCQFSPDYETPDNLLSPKVYALRHKKMDEIDRSQSGAAFVLFSDYILQQGGVVYGVGYEGHFRAVHKRAETAEERDEFRRSKYVQSDVSTAFRDVKADLKNGRIVLFSGTPCQVAGLRKYVGLRLSANLYTLDLVCHGVPAPFVWRDYLVWLERKKGRRIVKVDFRNKNLFGWKSHKETFNYDDDTYTYTYTFYQHINLRYSCSKCPFTNFRRSGDVTIGDYWGIERLDTTFGEDNRGCSLVLLNTEKSLRWFDAVKANADYKESDTQRCVQPQLVHPVKQHPQREQYERDFVERGFPYVAYRYGDLGYRYYLRMGYKALRRIGGLFLRTLGWRK